MTDMWEYEVQHWQIQQVSTRRLNLWGRERWELVKCIHHHSPYRTPDEVTVVFRRRKADGSEKLDLNEDAQPVEPIDLGPDEVIQELDLWSRVENDPPVWFRVVAIKPHFQNIDPNIEEPMVGKTPSQFKNIRFARNRRKWCES